MTVVDVYSTRQEAEDMNRDVVEIAFPFSSAQRDRFRLGTLLDEWAARYPNIFDERDVAIAKNQPPYHFFEWLAAVLFYEAAGYLSLIEKYETALHDRKIEVFRKTVPPAVCDDVLANRSGLPDLLVYAPNSENWFFCEIKGANDRLKPHQIERFETLAALSRRPVRILRFREITSNAGV